MLSRPNLQDAISSANRSAIYEIVPRLREHWLASEKGWLSIRNPYRRSIADVIDNAPNVNQTQLAEYVAASAIVHCFDGWSYLSRAFEAEIAGDPDTSRHLGYYAELRAAMSLLAASGIGVCRNNHVIVVGPKQCYIVQAGGTHQFTWKALENWSGLQVGTDVLFDVIKPGGIPLKDWLEQLSAGTRFITSEWLSQWGLDLALWKQDRKARNVVSYNPSAFNTPGPLPVNDTMENVSRFWEICNPEAVGGFPVLDRYLLRLCMSMVIRKTNESKQIYDERLLRVLDSINLMRTSNDLWVQFLGYEQLSNSHPIIKLAAAKNNIYDPTHSKEVLARATLLLRVATGSTADLLKEAGPTVKEDLEFWWTGSAVRRRLWPITLTPVSFCDLWQDIEEVIDSMDHWPQDHHTLWSSYARELATLTSVERAFLWGVGI